MLNDWRAYKGRHGVLLGSFILLGVGGSVRVKHVYCLFGRYKTADIIKGVWNVMHCMLRD